MLLLLAAPKPVQLGLGSGRGGHVRNGTTMAGQRESELLKSGMGNTSLPPGVHKCTSTALDPLDAAPHTPEPSHTPKCICVNHIHVSIRVARVVLGMPE